jgi:alpha-N-arabinofuranosidase
MTGLERNSDLIVMASYAPLLTNVNPGGLQWDTDLIGYDAMRSYGSPSYYAQVMFGSYLGTEKPASTIEGAAEKTFYSVTEDTAKKKVYLKLVNASTVAQPLEIHLAGSRLAGEGKLVTLRAASPEATNTIDQPKIIAPVESALKTPGDKLHFTAPPLSIEVLEFTLR